jgi:hypothetical protein
MFVMFLVLSSVIIIPFTLGFSVDPAGGLLIFNIATDIFFALDMIACFRTCVLLEGGAVVTDSCSIVNCYLRGWFVIDFFSTFPLDDVVTLVMGGGANLRSIKLIKALRLIRLLKMARLLKLKKSAKSLEKVMTLSPGAQRMLKLFFQV